MEETFKEDANYEDKKKFNKKLIIFSMLDSQETLEEDFSMDESSLKILDPLFF
jgi:hypothetical protein